MFTFLDLRKQDKMQWLQNPNQKNVDYPNNVKREDIRPFRNKKKAIKNLKSINFKLTEISNYWRHV
jgi:hypothetical protein